MTLVTLFVTKLFIILYILALLLQKFKRRISRKCHNYMFLKSFESFFKSVTSVTLFIFTLKYQERSVYMDFYQIVVTPPNRNGVCTIKPEFKVCRSKDIMVRGRSFYAVWDEASQLWSFDEYLVQRIIDEQLYKTKEELEAKNLGIKYKVHCMGNFSTGVWRDFRSYMNNISDNTKIIDEHLTFANTVTTKKDYISKRLSYNLEPGDISAYDEMISTLYATEERAKLEWAIGSIITGDSINIQKFIVLYGEAGTGKSTILNIIQQLFDGYYTTFEAKALTSSNNAFSTEVFKDNPLVAIQHDGDLSKIEDNSKFNSIISHEKMTLNEKYKPSYTSRINSFLFMGTNKPVKITDAKSGLIRRLIDVKPTGNLLPARRYQTLMKQIEFELGAIAYHCAEVYKEMGKNYYNDYRPIDMMFTTDLFFNFVESNYDIFLEQDGITLSQAYEMYKNYCDESLVDFKLAKYKFREELKSYFSEYHNITRVDGVQIRSYYKGFLWDKFARDDKGEKEVEADTQPKFILDQDKSILDDILKDQPAQYASAEGIPKRSWENNKQKLKDIKTSKLHYVQLPQNHIVIDFDLKNDEGVKDREKNLQAISDWPPTYAEFSKSGSGVHLHYIYSGDISKLSRLYSEDIEIKIPTGNSALRRKLSKCNNLAIAILNGGLPLREDKVLDFKRIADEQHLRNVINKNLKKEIHPNTASSVSMILKVLEDAQKSKIIYDVTDMRQAILVFAMGSTNQAQACMRMVDKMIFKSADEGADTPFGDDDKALYFFDLEVYPNLFVAVFKRENSPLMYKMINPTAKELEPMLKKRLVGYNNRRYDNHILYARYIGYDNLELYNLSQQIISNNRNVLFREAYNLSYTDVYDYASAKMSLKKQQIRLKLYHKEMSIPWDKPVPKELWPTVVDYCVNDVVTTEQTHQSLAQDFNARLILAELSGLTPNSTTQAHTAEIIFGKDKYKKDKLVYTDLSDMFPGYTYEYGKSTYRGEAVGEGGWVYAKPGMYEKVLVLDVESMHPNSIRALNMFGDYTKNYTDLVDIRVAIKNGELDKARGMFDGRLNRYLEDEGSAKKLSQALKIVINIVYGLTSASFDNPFRDPRNKDNIVAKRGSLFMIELKHRLEKKGVEVIHIKTDSIKLQNPSKEIIDYVIDFGTKYGYKFKEENNFDKFCLVNDAVYVAREGNEWSSVGAQFKHPVVFKSLFSKEVITFDDRCETKEVKSSIYLDFNEKLVDVSAYEKELEYVNKDIKKLLEPDDALEKRRDELIEKIAEGHDYHFVGRIGSFVPVVENTDGALLKRDAGDNKYAFVTGTKGYRWKDSYVVKELGLENTIDQRYYDELIRDAIDTISKFGDFDYFVSNDIKQIA